MTPEGAHDPHSPKNHISAFFEERKIQRLGVAVSGGSDSMALLDLLAAWSSEHDVGLLAATVDHGLRPEARAEAAFVADECKERSLEHEVLRWVDWDGQGNLQAKARDARYRLLAEWARKNDLDAVALGHTRDDQAETFLMRLARQSGVDGLSGMARATTRNGVLFLRPLLELGRDRLRSHLTTGGISWCDDPSNEDMSFDRIKARKALDELRPLGISPTGIVRSAAYIGSAASALREYTRREAAIHIREDHGDLLIPTDANIPDEIRRRLLVAALQYVGRGVFPPGEEGLFDLAKGLSEQGRRTLAGCLVSQSSTEMRIAREPNAVRSELSSPGELWDGRWILIGPASDTAYQVKALGEDGLPQCDNWRAIGLPRASLLASPSVWHKDTLIAAPLAGLSNGWKSTLAVTFAEFLAQKGP